MKLKPGLCPALSKMLNQITRYNRSFIRQVVHAIITKNTLNTVSRYAVANIHVRRQKIRGLQLRKNRWLRKAVHNARVCSRAAF